MSVNMERVGFGCLMTMVCVLVVGVFVILGGVAIDSAQEYRTFDAQTACRAKRMEPVRKAFSTSVHCVPAITRQDTLTVQR